MSYEIKPHDLVRVAYPTPCCGNALHRGYTFYVSSVKTLGGDGVAKFRCIFCHHEFSSVTIAAEFGVAETHDVRMLKRIDPPAIDDETETEREAVES